jgi:hypothetical protein
MRRAPNPDFKARPLPRLARSLALNYKAAALAGGFQSTKAARFLNVN